jgi:hypothetical protein
MAKTKKNAYETSFDIDTIEAKKGKALSVSKKGNLNMNAKVANPDYDEDCKDKKDPSYYSMKSIDDCFDFFLIKADGSTTFRIKDHLNLAGGTTVTGFPKEWTPSED